MVARESVEQKYISWRRRFLNLLGEEKPVQSICVLVSLAQP